MNAVIAAVLQVVGVVLVAVAVGAVWLPGSALVVGAASFAAGWSLEHADRQRSG